MNLYRVLSVFRFHQNHNSIQEADCHFILLELIADAKAVICLTETQKNTVRKFLLFSDGFPRLRSDGSYSGDP